ncbi:hypothetical protein Tco_0857196 [Tanacetum coccineum]|uniref:Uncharacterized protein n=1 Tax=Tanacetum coccineum TaxID=301880 RepID=A0ABQ5B9T5_9ASTR
MKQDNAKQAARDEKFVPSEDRVKIGKSNLRMDPSVTQREETYQVALDTIKNTPFYNAFLITVDVPEIYMQQCINLGEPLQLSSTDVYRGRHLQYHIDNCQSKVKRGEIMPYPRFTKAIIHHFITKHKSISTRQGSPYHIVDDDEVLDKLKLINKGDIYQVYGKPIPDTWITDEIKKSEAYKMYFKYSTGLIPPKKGRGRVAQGTKAIDALKQTNIVRKKTTDALKKKQPKRKLVLHEESVESEEELEHRPTGRKKRTPRAVVIQEPPGVLVKKSHESSGKLKGIELLSDAAHLEIETQRAIKASRRESRFQHQTGGSSKGAGLRPEVPDELTGKSTNSDEGASTSPEVPDESEDKSEARDDLDDWGSTDDEEYLLAYKDEKPKDISWQSTDDEESENDDEEDESDEDKSINIEKTNDERTDTHDKDTVMGKAKNTVEQKEDEEHGADEEQKGDEHAGDEQVMVPVSTTQKERPSLLQSPSSHSVSLNFRNQFLNSPNASLIVTVSVIPETTHQPPSTPLVPPLPATKIPSTQIPNSEALNSVVQRFTALEQAVKELKQDDHSASILALIRSQKELCEKWDYKDIIEESVQDNAINEVKNFLLKYLPQAVKEALKKTPSFLANMEKGDKPDTVLKKRDRGDDQDEDPSARANQGKKTKKRSFNESESSKKTSTTKESSKDKSPAKTSKSGKSVITEEPVDDPVFEKALDDVQQTFDDKVDDAGQPPHTVTDETQPYADPKIPKKDWFKDSPKPEVLDLGTPSKPLMILQNSRGLMRWYKLRSLHSRLMS